MRASHWKATLVQTTHLVLTNELPISSTVCSIFSKLVHPKHAIRYERQHSSEAMLFYWNRPYKHASTVNSPKSAMNRKESVRFDYAFHSEWVSPEMQPSGMAVKICLSSSSSRVAHKSALDRTVHSCLSIRENVIFWDDWWLMIAKIFCISKSQNRNLKNILYYFPKNISCAAWVGMIARKKMHLISLQNKSTQ